MYGKNKEKPVSVLQGDQKFVAKILSRNSSVDGSLSLSPGYPKTPSNVPFGWETMPGTPKNPSAEIFPEFSKPVRPPPPPPVVESGDLPEPHFIVKQDILSLPKARFWKKIMWKKKKKIHQPATCSERFQSYNSDANFMPFTSSIIKLRSSSSSLSSCYGLDHRSRKSSNLKVLARKIVNWAF